MTKYKINLWYIIKASLNSAYIKYLVSQRKPYAFTMQNDALHELIRYET